eukprot:1160222-Pelagomonas_calceolata.AAC.11
MCVCKGAEGAYACMIVQTAGKTYLQLVPFTLHAHPGARGAQHMSCISARQWEEPAHSFIHPSIHSFYPSCAPARQPTQFTCAYFRGIWDTVSIAAALHTDIQLHGTKLTHKNGRELGPDLASAASVLVHNCMHSANSAWLSRGEGCCLAVARFDQWLPCRPATLQWQHRMATDTQEPKLSCASTWNSCRRCPSLLPGHYRDSPSGVTFS